VWVCEEGDGLCLDNQPTNQPTSTSIKHTPPNNQPKNAQRDTYDRRTRAQKVLPAVALMDKMTGGLG
jgi:hypothetical protein